MVIRLQAFLAAPKPTSIFQSKTDPIKLLEQPQKDNKNHTVRTSNASDGNALSPLTINWP